MSTKNKTQNIIKTTKKVFEDCLLPNNCLVAAPSHMPYYPTKAKNYLYSWPGRDSGYNLNAGLLIGIDYYDEHCRWLWNRAENLRQGPDHLADSRGILRRSYHPNGRVHETTIQPDQNGTLLWSLGVYSQNHQLSRPMEQIAQLLAEGLTRHWTGKNFDLAVEDLWEERSTSPAQGNNFAYTLAATSAGLSWAGEYLNEQALTRTSRQMKEEITEQAYHQNHGHFLCRFDDQSEPASVIDASILGLVWPFEILEPSDERMSKTIDVVKERLLGEHGLHRYRGDQYTGEIEMGAAHPTQGAGAWPLLTLWLAIVETKRGNQKEAQKLFDMVVSQADDDGFLPEQVFPEGDPRIGIKPLLWSHGMFLHAASILGYLN